MSDIWDNLTFAFEVGTTVMLVAGLANPVVAAVGVAITCVNVGVDIYKGESIGVIATDALGLVGPVCGQVSKLAKTGKAVGKAGKYISKASDATKTINKVFSTTKGAVAVAKDASNFQNMTGKQQVRFLCNAVNVGYDAKDLKESYDNRKTDSKANDNQQENSKKDTNKGPETDQTPSREPAPNALPDSSKAKQQQNHIRERPSMNKPLPVHAVSGTADLNAKSLDSAPKALHLVPKQNLNTKRKSVPNVLTTASNPNRDMNQLRNRQMFPNVPLPTSYPTLNLNQLQTRQMVPDFLPTAFNADRNTNQQRNRQILLNTRLYANNKNSNLNLPPARSKPVQRHRRLRNMPSMQTPLRDIPSMETPLRDIPSMETPLPVSSMCVNYTGTSDSLVP